MMDQFIDQRKATVTIYKSYYTEGWICEISDKRRNLLSTSVDECGEGMSDIEHAILSAFNKLKREKDA